MEHASLFHLTKKQGFALFAAAFVVRAIVMAFIIQPNEFYKQADSNDYHVSGVTISSGNGMMHPQTGEPLFWRTPGYPLYLACFYWLCGYHGYEFSANRSAQCAAIWVQILLASLIPIILFFLARLLTNTMFIAYAIAWISVFHPGLVLASTYLLTEGLALIFFYLFLILFYKNIIPPSSKKWPLIIILAALSLSAYTWMRPMGEFVAYFCTLLLALCAIGSWRMKAIKAGLFAIVFFLSIAPWYWRNYQFTDELFFCPTIGTYLNVFSVPKILRRTLNKPILECHKIAQQSAAKEIYQQKLLLRGTDKYVSNAICKRAAYPIVTANPGYFVYDWMMEVIKTTFDLYSYQMVCMANGSYFYDPIEEFLPDKITACMYSEPLPWYGRIVAWLELIFQLLLWIGLLAGFYIFLLKTFFEKKISIALQNFRWLWLTTIPLIGIVVGMTGGFGYARLRLPVEPLLIILSLTWWFKKKL